MNNSKDIDKIFKESIRNFAKKPSHSVWGNLENRLAKDKAKPKNLFRKILLFVLCFLFISALGVYSIYQYSSLSDNSKSMAHVDSKKVITEVEALTSTLNIETPAIAKSVESEIILGKESGQLSNSQSYDTKLISSSEIREHKILKPTLNSFNSKPENSSTQSIQQIEKSLNPLKELRAEYNFIEDTNENSFNSKINNSSLITGDKISKSRELEINNFIMVLNSSLFYEKKLEIQFSQLSKPVHLINSKKRFSFSIEKSIWGNGFRTLKDNGQKTEEHINYFNSVEQKSSSSSVALLFTYHTSLFSIESGIEYSKNSIIGNQDFHITYIPNEFNEFLYTTSFNTNRYGIIPQNILEVEPGDLVSFDNQIHQSQTYVSLPLHLFKSFEISKLRFDFGVGTNINFPLTKSLEIRDSNDPKIISQMQLDYQEDNSRIFLGYSGKFKINYLMRNNLYFSAGISHRRSFTSANKNKLVNYYPYDSRIILGIQTDF